jgi:hypothetical protein
MEVGEDDKKMEPVNLLSAQDRADLQWAHQRLEHPSLAARLSHLLGTPIEQALRLLPANWYKKLQVLTEISIRKALELAIESMEPIPPAASHDRLHKLMAFGTGSLGGLLGPLTLVVELPVTTNLMLRSIADIAHRQGEDLSTTEARIACMQVFALGGRTHADEAAETGYYGLRMTLGLHFPGIAVVRGGNAGPGVSVPGSIQFIRAIASRFGVVVSDKAAAQMIPLAGALSGGLVNLLFMQHFQDMAQGHFMVRRLERQYGSDVIRRAYEQCTREAEAAEHFSPLEGW